MNWRNSIELPSISIAPDAIDVTGFESPVRTFFNSISPVLTVTKQLSRIELFITATWFLIVILFLNPDENKKQTDVFSLMLLSGLYLVDNTSNKVSMETYSKSSTEVLSNKDVSTNSSLNSNAEVKK